MNKERYSDILRRPKDAVRTNGRFLLHDNAPAHRSVLVKDFFAKKNVTKLVLIWLQLISPVPLT